MDEYRLIEDLGIPVAESRIGKNRDDAVKMAEEIGYPVVMKIASKDILHKTEAKGVWLNLSSPDEVKRAFEKIMEDVKAYNKDARIDGVLVQKFYEGGTEVILGLTSDKVFGYAVMFGLGGILTEVLKDVTYRIGPVDEGEASEMIKEISASEVLTGFRGNAPKDTEALAKAISAFSKLGDKMAVKEAEINPLLVFEDGVVAVDVRIIPVIE